MKKAFEDAYRELRNGFFLSSIQGKTDGVFCSERSEGCVMIQLGLYLAEPPAYGKARGPYRWSFLPPDPKECTDFLAEECRKAKGVSRVLTCLNLAAPRLEWGLQAAESFLKAGGDFIELNVHGAYWRYLEVGKMRAMVLPENQSELFKWIEAFTKLEIPLIVKFYGKSNRRPLLQVLGEMMNFSVFGVHINVRSEKTKKPDFGFVRRMRGKYSGFLLASGYVRSATDAKELFEAGADMVGIAEPTIEDSKYIHRITEELKAKHSPYGGLDLTGRKNQPRENLNETTEPIARSGPPARNVDYGA
jgi:tRNA-dihydrouridine synthase